MAVYDFSNLFVVKVFSTGLLAPLPVIVVERRKYTLSPAEIVNGSVIIMTTLSSGVFNSFLGTIFHPCLWISTCPMEYVMIAFLAIESSATEYSTFSGNGKNDTSKPATATIDNLNINRLLSVGGCYAFIKRK